MTCSGDQTVTMVLKVDLGCHRCFRKVKKLLCQFPEIRNQTFDEKNNVVVITVVSCNPEKIRDKLCRKGCGSITSIEIRERPAHGPEPVRPAPPKPAPTPAPTPTPTPAPEKPKPAPPAPEQKPPRPAPPVAQCPPVPPPCLPTPVAPWPPVLPPCPPPHMFPVAVCYVPWPGWSGGPCRCNGCCVSWCCNCWCHDNPSVCSIM